MKDRDIETRLRQCFSGDPPPRRVRQQALGDSTAMLMNGWRRRSARRRAKQVAAAVLIAGIAFLGGRLSAPRELPERLETPPRVIVESDGVTVPSDVVAWLDTARLFGRLGMEERMARAVEHASKLLPHDSVATSSVMEQATVATGEGDLENQGKHSILTEILHPRESVESAGGIMAQSFGGYHHESKVE